MKLKKVCLLLFVILFFLLLTEITCIANYNHDGNLITEEDRRAADSYEKIDQLKSEAHKRGLYDSSGTYSRHQTYSSGYGELGTGYGFVAPSVVGHYQPVPNYGTSYPSHGSEYGNSFGHSGHGLTYAHGHGTHSALALKGLLIPLAGIALLGAAAALSTNPVLLQLGVVNGRRRRRRSFSPGVYPTNAAIKPHKK
ncbi:uncharacterized protein BDFB_008203 [Asbolus verrucosus]|uniref:Uncharacterized protein n=1 Tax=Asbolus verrucosus TaxID=1661398 RepID=A0A482VFN6_ASBVE|nr:uncharacterized protein BDFB_008203 [Asbolus verrucosus]